MLDELHYDESATNWIVKPWSVDGGGHEQVALLTDEQEATLQHGKVYECDAEPQGDSMRVRRIGEVVAEAV